MTNTHDFGRRLTTVTLARRGKMTMQELAAKTGIGRSRLSDLERGDRGAPLKVWELLALAEAFDEPVVNLLLGAATPYEVAQMMGAKVQ